MGENGIAEFAKAMNALPCVQCEQSRAKTAMATLAARTMSRRARRWEAAARMWRSELNYTRAVRDACDVARDQEYALRCQTEADLATARAEAEAYAIAAMAESLDATRAIAAQRDAALTERDTARRELGEVRARLTEAEAIIRYIDTNCDMTEVLHEAIEHYRAAALKEDKGNG